MEQTTPLSKKLKLKQNLPYIIKREKKKKKRPFETITCTTINYSLRKLKTDSIISSDEKKP